MAEHARQIYIKNGTLVLENAVIEKASIAIDGQKIVGICEPFEGNFVEIDANGGYILPGFIDLHVHGGGGFDFMDGTAEAVIGVAKAHCKHGTTGLYATTMTCPDELLIKAIHAYKQAKTTEYDGAQLLGLHLEGPFFSMAGKGAQPVSDQRYPTREVLETIIKIGGGNIKRWDEAPELDGTEIFAEVTKKHGILPSIAHTNGVADDAHKAFALGFSHITHFYSATTTGRKINGIVYSGVNEATYITDDITIEVIADGKHIPKEHMLLAHKIKGADKMALITDAMRAAGTNDERSILGGKEGGVPVLIKDGVAQLLDLSSYAGSVGTMDNALRVALRYGLPLIDVVKMLSLTPARIMKIDKEKGSIEKGKDADIVIMDKNFTVQKVFVNGKLCYAV